MFRYIIFNINTINSAEVTDEKHTERIPCIVRQDAQGQKKRMASPVDAFDRYRWCHGISEQELGRQVDPEGARVLLRGRPCKIREVSRIRT